MKAETRYVADDGSTHATPLEALKADLRTMLAVAAGNDAISRQIADKIAADVEPWLAVLSAMHDARPDKPAELPLDHTPGGVKHWNGVEPDGARMVMPFGSRPTKFEVDTVMPHPNGGPPPVPASNRSPSDQ